VTNNSNSEKLLEILKNKFSNQLLEAKLTLGDVEIRINYKDILGVFNILKLDADLQFDMLLSVTATDYMDHEFMERKDPERFEMVYHLLSLK
jgi:NADH:ubiquinone oxidoreductase subunit C